MVHEAPTANSDRSVFADRVASLVVEAIDRLPGRGKPQVREWSVLAGIVAEHNGNMEVVCLATGTRCVGTDGVERNDGLLVADCHAEILTRRLLRRCLMAEVRRDGPPVGSIRLLERVPQEEFSNGDDHRNLRWRQVSKLHLYVSHLPCGEASLLPLKSEIQGSRGRAHREIQRLGAGEPFEDRNRTGAKLAFADPADLVADPVSGPGMQALGQLRIKAGRTDIPPERRTQSLCCSDKLRRWNTIGWEGALLSAFVDRVSVASVIVGGELFDSAALEAALGSGTEYFHTEVQWRSTQERSCNFRDSKLVTSGLALCWAREGLEVGDSIGKRTDVGYLDVLNGADGIRQGVRKRGHDGELAANAVSPLCKSCWASSVVATVHSIGYRLPESLGHRCEYRALKAAIGGAYHARLAALPQPLSLWKPKRLRERPAVERFSVVLDRTATDQSAE
eukprot:TRINITY_DN60867_c0_g1_i1.p1 TRINITY_DN60867_c0_g1~~TRINITY_DN60867_c0_g1_i1.p1  ORF type:complete len:492 (+),score=54.25 TRINITY_DN60867_c0_g1_i1:128-1477(+)